MGNDISHSTNRGLRVRPAPGCRTCCCNELWPEDPPRSASDALGVLQRRGDVEPPAVAPPFFSQSVRLTPACAFEPGRFRDPELFASPAVGVGINPRRAIVARLGFGPLGRSRLIPPWFVPYCWAVGVGNNPEAVPLVRGAEGGSR
jgi:hypothetical protein